MKTSSLLPASILLVALALLPVSITASVSVFVAASVLALAARDYAREIKPLTAPVAAAAPRHSLRLAA